MHIPPKLPGTTNFVFTSSKKEYNEISAMATIVTAENKIPPLKNLVIDINIRLHLFVNRHETYALPKNSTPVPTNDFNN